MGFIYSGTYVPLEETKERDTSQPLLKSRKNFADANQKVI